MISRNRNFLTDNITKMIFSDIDYFIVFFNLFHKINLLEGCNMLNPFTLINNLTFLVVYNFVIYNLFNVQIKM